MPWVPRHSASLWSSLHCQKAQSVLDQANLPRTGFCGGALTRLVLCLYLLKYMSKSLSMTHLGQTGPLLRNTAVILNHTKRLQRVSQRLWSFNCRGLYSRPLLAVAIRCSEPRMRCWWVIILAHKCIALDARAMALWILKHIQLACTLHEGRRPTQQVRNPVWKNGLHI